MTTNTQRFEIIQLVEMTISHVVIATDAAAANRAATERTMRVCASLSRRCAAVTFGDVDDNFVPAPEGPETESE